MNKGDMAFMLVKQAANYRASGTRESIKRNMHMNSCTESDVWLATESFIDAVIVDLLNYFAREQGMDLGLCTTDFQVRVAEAKRKMMDAKIPKEDIDEC